MTLLYDARDPRNFVDVDWHTPEVSSVDLFCKEQAALYASMFLNSSVQNFGRRNFKYVDQYEKVAVVLEEVFSEAVHDLKKASEKERADFSDKR